MDSYSDEITYPDSPVLDGSTGLKCDFCEHVLCSREQLLKHLQGHLCLDPACESCHHTPDAFLEHISNAKNHIKSNKVEAQRSSPENPIGNFQERGGHSASSNDEESQYVREDLPIARRKHKFFCTECDRSFHYKKDLTKHTLDNCYLATKGILNNVDMAFGSKNDDDLSTSDKVPLSITGETNNSNPESRVIFKNSLSTATKQVDIYSCCGNNGSAKLKILEDQVKSTSALKSDYHRKEAAPEETNVNNACSLPVGNHTYFCFSCGMSFTHKHFLSNHMKRHSESDHFCRYCGSGFATAFNVRRHENLHFPKNYRCPLCMKTFAHVYYLKVHMSSHSDVRKYLCNVCEKVFKTKYGLNKHSLRH